MRLTHRHTATAVGLLMFVIYHITMNRTLGFIDKGELATVATTLGVAHPTGYPSFTLLGHLFTLLPIRPILALNIMSALLTAAGCAVTVLLVARVIETMSRGSARTEKRGEKKERKGKETVQNDSRIDRSGEPTIARLLIPACAGLLLGLGSIWWGQGNGVEVYSLHALLLPLVILLYLRWTDGLAEESGGWRASRRGVAFALAVGLAFTNHMSTVFIAPALLVDYFMRMQAGHSPRASRWQRYDAGSQWRRLGALVPWTLLGLLPWLYLPLRASSGPLLNWGDPSSLDRLLAHVAGRQYSVWMMSTGTMGEQIGWFVRQIPAELGIVGLALAAFGLAALWRSARRLALLAVGVIVTCVVWAGLYAIYDIGSYFMAATLGLVLLVAAGAWEIARRWGAGIGIGAIAAAVVTAGVLNWRASDESGNVAVEEMTRNVLDGLPQRAMIMSSDWDFWVSGSLYMQHVEGHRPDVIVIDQELLRRSWYIDQLAAQHPTLMTRVRAETENFQRAVRPFEQGESFDPGAIDAAYFGMIDAIIAAAQREGRRVYVTRDVERRIAAGQSRLPEGLAFRLSADTSYHPVSFPAWRYTPWFGRVDHYTLRVPEIYALAAMARGRYEKAHGNDSLAERYRRLALGFEPPVKPRDVPDLPLDAERIARAALEIFGQIGGGG